MRELDQLLIHNRPSTASLLDPIKGAVHEYFVKAAIWFRQSDAAWALLNVKSEPEARPEDAATQRRY